MTETQHLEPSEQLHRMLADAPRREIEALLESLSPSELARAVSRLAPADQEHLMVRLRPDDAADLVEHLPAPQAAEIVERLAPPDAARIVHELKSCDQADLIAELPDEGARAILSEMAPLDAAELRALADYAEDSAGGLMVTEYLAFPEDLTVTGVITDLRQRAGKYSDYDVQYAYVVTRRGKLVGVLRLRDLLLAPEQLGIGSVMIRGPKAVPASAGLDELQEFFSRHHFLGVPVVDDVGRLVGVVHRAAVDLARSERSELEHLRAQGIVGGEELRSMPVWRRSRRRLAWLSVNVVLNLFAAGVIAAYQETLQAAITLAVFLPIISDMSGCSGNQAVAVTMRELSLGVVQPRDLGRVLWAEARVGLINGVVLGVLVALLAWLWKGNVYLGLVVGAALALNTVVAVSIGGTVPLLLRRLGRDPALASGPLLTTVTDMCGFFLTLAFAAAVLSRLV
ncbi:MAG: magnesium transporter [Planctomycetota bacterium]